MVAMPRSCTAFANWQVAMILRVSVLKRADGGDPHAVKIGAGFSGIALKIAMQSTLLLRNRQLVVRLGEMVHADVEIAGFDEFHQARSGIFRTFACLPANEWRRRLAAF